MGCACILRSSERIHLSHAHRGRRAPIARRSARCTPGGLLGDSDVDVPAGGMAGICIREADGGYHVAVASVHLGTRLISTAAVLDDSNFTILESILVHTEARECAILSHSQELSQLLARCNIKAHSGPAVHSRSKSYSIEDMLKYVQATHQHEARMELEKESRVQQASLSPHSLRPHHFLLYLEILL